MRRGLILLERTRLVGAVLGLCLAVTALAGAEGAAGQERGTPGRVGEASMAVLDTSRAPSAYELALLRDQLQANRDVLIGQHSHYARCVSTMTLVVSLFLAVLSAVAIVGAYLVTKNLGDLRREMEKKVDDSVADTVADATRTVRNLVDPTVANVRERLFYLEGRFDERSVPSSSPRAGSEPEGGKAGDPQKEGPEGPKDD